MGLDRARAQAMLVLAAIIAAVMVAGVGGAASATPRPAPSVSYRQSGDQSVTVVGRTVGAAARVRFEARRGSAWIAASRTRAHRHRYSTTL